jgi:redox-sensing transcriptional repressor
MFEKRGVDVVAMFDVSAEVVGKKVGAIHIYHMDELETKLDEFGVNIVILTMPKEFAPEVALRLDKTGIGGVWNFTGKEISLASEIVVENVHIGDSLMSLCYEVAKEVEK